MSIQDIAFQTTHMGNGFSSNTFNRGKLIPLVRQYRLQHMSEQGYYLDAEGGADEFIDSILADIREGLQQALQDIPETLTEEEYNSDADLEKVLGQKS